MRLSNNRSVANSFSDFNSPVIYLSVPCFNEMKQMDFDSISSEMKALDQRKSTFLAATEKLQSSNPENRSQFINAFLGVVTGLSCHLTMNMPSFEQEKMRLEQIATKVIDVHNANIGLGGTNPRLENTLEHHDVKALMLPGLYLLWGEKRFHCLFADHVMPYLLKALNVSTPSGKSKPLTETSAIRGMHSFAASNFVEFLKETSGYLQPKALSLYIEELGFINKAQKILKGPIEFTADLCDAPQNLKYNQKSVDLSILEEINSLNRHFSIKAHETCNELIQFPVEEIKQAFIPLEKKLFEQLEIKEGPDTSRKVVEVGNGTNNKELDKLKLKP